MQTQHSSLQRRHESTLDQLRRSQTDQLASMSTRKYSSPPSDPAGRESLPSWRASPVAAPRVGSSAAEPWLANSPTASPPARTASSPDVARVTARATSPSLTSDASGTSPTQMLRAAAWGRGLDIESAVEEHGDLVRRNVRMAREFELRLDSLMDSLVTSLSPASVDYTRPDFAATGPI